MDTTIYIQRSDGAYVSYDGMTQAGVVAMLAAQGLTCSVISKVDFMTAIVV